MYSKSFYIGGSAGNNSFGQPARNGRQLFVPKLIRGSFNDMIVGEEIAFEELDENNEIISFHGLQNFIETEYFGVPTYIFDNHNHAYFFWNLAKIKGIILNHATLIHIDEHSDMREPEKYQDENEIYDIRKIFEYTNFILNVGNYIKPAIKSGLISNIHNIQSEIGLDEISSAINDMQGDIIMNLDLDFFSDEMEYIDFEKKKKIILQIAKKSKLITISTSPYFISQNKAINICKDIFR